jgi:hypothetical protein
MRWAHCVVVRGGDGKTVNCWGDTFDNCTTNEQSKSYEETPAFQWNQGVLGDPAIFNRPRGRRAASCVYTTVQTGKIL